MIQVHLWHVFPALIKELFYTFQIFVFRVGSTNDDRLVLEHDNGVVLSLSIHALHLTYAAIHHIKAENFMT